MRDPKAIWAKAVGGCAVAVPRSLCVVLDALKCMFVFLLLWVEGVLRGRPIALPLGNKVIDSMRCGSVGAAMGKSWVRRFTIGGGGAKPERSRDSSPGPQVAATAARYRSPFAVCCRFIGSMLGQPSMILANPASVI